MPKPSTVPLAATSTLAPTTTSAAVTAPAPTTTSATATTTPSGPLTAKELDWIQAITRLADKLFYISIDASSADSAPALRSYAAGLRGCRRELARIVPPSERLRPAYETAKGACAQYDKAAQCFAAAASTAPAGAAGKRRRERSVACGVEAADEGSYRFVDAIAEAESIDTAAELAP